MFKLILYRTTPKKKKPNRRNLNWVEELIDLNAENSWKSSNVGNEEVYEKDRVWGRGEDPETTMFIIYTIIKRCLGTPRQVKTNHI